ncbi:MAG: MarR family transcriptional regulator [Selenomonadaceae bacterium]|nr:MarR family transcriptional regulator [Selenomonadaceae bacterium]
MLTRNNLTNALLETYNLMRCYHTTWYGKNFDGLDPWQGQGRILTALRRMHSVSQKELGKVLGIRPQSLGELLQKLEVNGYITRYRSDTDRRALIVELTAKGETFQLRKPNYDEMFIDLNAKEKATLKNCLEKISERLNELIERENEDEFY